jgi:hypothetical protein
LDVWAEANISGYSGKNAPTIVLTKADHDATRRVFDRWRIDRTGSLTGHIDWTKVSPREIQALAERMFDAANIPNEVRREYFREFHKYIYQGYCT